MVWFFTSDERYVRCETRYGPGGRGFELVITGPDGAETVECYADQRQLSARWIKLESEMQQNGWAGPRPCDF